MFKGRSETYWMGAWLDPIIHRGVAHRKDCAIWRLRLKPELNPNNLLVDARNWDSMDPSAWALWKPRSRSALKFANGVRWWQRKFYRVELTLSPTATVTTTPEAAIRSTTRATVDAVHPLGSPSERIIISCLSSTAWESASMTTEQKLVGQLPITTQRLY